MSLKEKIYILGGGESGVGAALLAKKLGWDVFVSDAGELQEKYRRELVNNHISFEEGGHEEVYHDRPDLIIKSPGIPDTSEIVEHFRADKVEIISEIEFGVRNAGSSKFVSITGTNGKTTTTLLTYHILSESGFSVGLAGNVGTSLARQIAGNPKETYVVELSSFQLDDLYSLHSSTAIITNITPDHLDRYDNIFQNYIDSKFRILQNMTTSDHLIISNEDEVVNKQASILKPVVDLQRVSLEEQVSLTCCKTAKGLEISNGKLILEPKDIPLKGNHNLLNVMMAAQAAMNMGAAPAQVKKAISSFKNAPHRLEWIADIEGVSFINDSKATNVDSVFYALGAFEAPITWIAGGVDKGNDYSALRDLARDKVKSLICLGKDSKKLHEAFKNIIPRIMDTTDIKAAARMALKYAEKNDTVLLSPACASFDLFKNYEDRGDQFREAVLKLKEEIESNLKN